MVKLEFENPPPSKEALEESQAAAVERVSGKKRKKSSSSSKPTSVTPSFLETADLMTGQSVDPVAVQQQQEIVADQISTTAQTRAEVIKRSFQPRPNVSPEVIPTPRETTRTSQFSGLEPTELRQAGFEPQRFTGDVQPATNLRKPSQAFLDVREKLKPSTETEPVRFRELPIAAGIVIGEAGSQLTEFARGAVVDPINVVVNPIETVFQPLAETSAGLITGSITPQDISRDISESVIKEPARAAGNIAFDIASGKLFIGGRQKFLSELSAVEAQEFFRSASTGQPFKVPPKKTQVVSVLELPEGLTLADETPRKRLVDVKEEFTEGILPVLDESSGAIKELQVQLVPDKTVKVTTEGLPVSQPEGIKSTRSLIEQQTELPSVQTPATEAFRTLFDADVDIGTFQAKKGIDPFMDAKPKDTQLPLDTTFEQSVKRQAPNIVIERTEPALPSAQTSKRLLATPDPVSALFQTATDPEFLAFTQKEFERLKTSTSRLQADIELPVSTTIKTPTLEYPISASSLAKQETTLVEPISTRSLPDIQLPTQPISETAQGKTLSDLSRDFKPPETEAVPSLELIKTPKQDLIVDSVVDQQRKSRSKQKVDTVQEVRPVQDQDILVTPNVITIPEPLFSPARAFRPREQLVPKPKPRPKEKVKRPAVDSFFTVVIGREGLQTFRTVRARSLREAVSIGQRGVLETAAASLEIRPVGRALKPEEESFIEDFLGDKFRKSKVDKKRFVQKRETRISSLGEKRDITFKGLGSLRSKSGSLFGAELVSKGFKLRDVRRLL